MVFFRGEIDAELSTGAGVQSIESSPMLRTGSEEAIHCVEERMLD